MSKRKIKACLNSSYRTLLQQLIEKTGSIQALSQLPGFSCDTSISHWLNGHNIPNETSRKKIEQLAIDLKIIE